MAIQTYQQYRNARKVEIPFYANSLTSVAGYIYSYWQDLINLYGRAASVPSGQVQPDITTNGALVLPTVLSGQKIYLDYIEIFSSATGMVYLEDRIVGFGGLNGTLVSLQGAGSVLDAAVAQNRCSQNGEDVIWFAEWYTATGGTTVTATISYTNEANISNTMTLSIPASTPAKRRYQLYPTINDAFIRTISNLTLSVTTGTAGNFGVTATKRIASMPILVPNVVNFIDFTGTGFIEINPNSCLTFSKMCTGTAGGTLIGKIGYVIG